MGYLLRDLAALAALSALAAHLESPWALAPLWLAQGTVAWALFVIGHDCGHGSFSGRRWLDSLIGHLTHTLLLVPYHAWRLSHRIHHRHAGDIERDETWFPLTTSQVAALSPWVHLVRFHLLPLAAPLYLLRRTPAREGASHFDPRSPLVPRGARAEVCTSIGLCGLMLLLLVGCGFAYGPGFVLCHYGAPYSVFASWFALVTYLHHTDRELPWYRGTGWSFLRGALSTMDRHYGPFERIHHDAGTHLVHHLFPSIPHYHLRAATAAIRPVLGRHYRVAREPVWRALWTSLRGCGVVPEEGDCVYYTSLPRRAAAARGHAPRAGDRGGHRRTSGGAAPRARKAARHG